MRFKKALKLKEIANIIEAEIVGPEDFLVSGMNEIHRVEEGDIVFVDHPKYYDKALNSRASVILINKKVEVPEGKALLVSEKPFTDFVKLGQFFNPEFHEAEMLSETADIDDSSYIGPNVFVGRNVKIGKNCVIHTGVCIGNNTRIGDNVIIHSGTVLGGDAFYYKKTEKGFEKLKSIGDVVIEDDVEIGVNCTIDRGVTSSTVIGKGSKLDNQIQIGHDTTLGENCLIASQVGIAGCCTIGNNVVFWGQSACTSGIEIGDNAVISAKSGVSKSLKGGKLYMGMPAEEGKTAYKKYALLSRLPEIIKKIEKFNLE